MRVRTGAEVLAADGFARLKGLSVGLVTNQTGVLPGGTATADALRAAEGVKLRALFGPEHGVRGDVPAGKYVASGTDAKTGVPVYSLYGRTKVPTAAMLKGLDLLVFDIQDIGCRSYTYLSTLGCVLEGGARHKVPVLVLDRPNPLGLTRVEGGPPSAGFFSFIGKYATAYRHGLTMGEAAKMINGRDWLPGSLRADLSVAACDGLSRGLAGWESFGGLPWVRTSPNVPHTRTPLYYAATGIVGELPTVSIGIGTDFPFEVIGAPGADADRLAKELDALKLEGFAYRPQAWTPAKGTYSGRRCAGVRVAVADVSRAQLCRFNFAAMAALRKAAPALSLFGSSASSRMFDYACGSDRVRRAYLAGKPEPELWAAFQGGVDGFAAARKPYLLY
ncbi:MAG TPA: DUF1343 domain-containing protein [Armatimonadaceae bacterium]|nr:DUF1343 domain-containing protein [Armatimonadaceae bacterium]